MRERAQEAAGEEVRSQEKGRTAGGLSQGPPGLADTLNCTGGTSMHSSPGLLAWSKRTLSRVWCLASVDGLLKCTVNTVNPVHLHATPAEYQQTSHHVHLSVAR